MRVKLDENLPGELADDLRSLGHDVDSVASEGLAGASDATVANAARAGGRVLFTLDKGLGDIRRFAPRRYAGVVVFRLDRTGRANVRQAVLAAIARLPAKNLAGRLAVVTASSIRTRR